MVVANAISVEVHKHSLADRWCVTRKDLNILRRQVREAIADGTVQPTERDPFDPDDDVIGPNVYTVTEQFVKPVTAKAGGMSWALLQHPDGLKCDLFVTHAWAEGTFEIIDKVLASRHAWICFLANPQNSNIAALVANPRGSPFALALQSATYMMVVPNASCSIYSRLWCAYEAFLAYEWDKFIFMATHNVRPHYCRAILTLLLYMMVGAATGFLWRWLIPTLPDVHAMIVWPISALVLVTAVVSLGVSNRRRRLCNRLGSFLSAHVLVVHSLDRECESMHDSLTIMFSMIVIYHVATERDRVKSAALLTAEEELAHEYTGSIKGAACSVALDEENIRAEIGACTEEVDKTIRVLLRAGMSTPTLRKAVDLGVDISGLAMKETSLVVTYALGGLVIHGYLLFSEERLLRALSAAILVLIASFFAFISLAGQDRRAVASRVVELIAISMLLPATCVSMCLWDYDKAAALGSAVGVWQWLLSLLLPIVGVERVAAVPYVGLCVAQLMAGYAPRRGHLSRCCRVLQGRCSSS